MKKLIILTLILSLLSCKGVMHVSTIKGGEDCYTELGYYDTSAVIKSFMQGKKTIVYFLDDSCVVIWGKKCAFMRGEKLRAKAEWWATPPGGSHWKYFLINKDESLRYSLLRNK